VAKLAIQIGRTMGLDDDEVEGIRLGGLLHDIGDLTVPRQILCFPGQLSRKQFEIVKEHARTGWSLLRDFSCPWPVARVALEHHERLDGSGYPQRLRGDEICLAARIVGVADVIEAMTADRPHRRALGLDQACEELARARGIRYDSDVVDACGKVLGGPEFVLAWHEVNRMRTHPLRS
jgi:HD-GYP domain-containing protein (c-di-GMP phosphodiesterase class II)